MRITGSEPHDRLINAATMNFGFACPAINDKAQQLMAKPLMSWYQIENDLEYTPWCGMTYVSRGGARQWQTGVVMVTELVPVRLISETRGGEVYQHLQPETGLHFPLGNHLAARSYVNNLMNFYFYFIQMLIYSLNYCHLLKHIKIIQFYFNTELITKCKKYFPLQSPDFRFTFVCTIQI